VFARQNLCVIPLKSALSILVGSIYHTQSIGTVSLFVVRAKELPVHVKKLREFDNRFFAIGAFNLSMKNAKSRGWILVNVNCERLTFIQKADAFLSDNMARKISNLVAGTVFSRRNDALQFHQLTVARPPDLGQLVHGTLSLPLPSHDGSLSDESV
jgi:hypothetical protein